MILQIAFWVPWLIGFLILSIVVAEELIEIVFCVRYAIYQQIYNIYRETSKTIRFKAFFFDLYHSFGHSHGLKHIIREKRKPWPSLKSKEIAREE